MIKRQSNSATARPPVIKVENVESVKDLFLETPLLKKSVEVVKVAPTHKSNSCSAVLKKNQINFNTDAISS